MSHIQAIETDCGLSQGILTALNAKLKHLPHDSTERHGVLILDEIALKPHIDLDVSKYKVIGIVDLGKFTSDI
ncbi:hypothetical protein JTE90_024770 [Oedothorax gibbosus]|uniref:Transposable element P transposase-like RNase H domain-containing protein n=1 Tax=Oedothorax gibbosus TaxID=931172 RepID=A0AAV6UAY1_9ARAC|nr:hypothetical protein JTE90_024770 [Oedothorax gibbosus]